MPQSREPRPPRRGAGADSGAAAAAAAALEAVLRGGLQRLQLFVDLHDVTQDGLAVRLALLQRAAAGRRLVLDGVCQGLDVGLEVPCETCGKPRAWQSSAPSRPPPVVANRLLS